MATVLSSLTNLLTARECLNQIRRMLANSVGAGAVTDDTLRVVTSWQGGIDTHIDAVVLDDSPTSYTSTGIDYSLYPGLTVLISATKTAAPGNLTITLPLSEDDGTTYSFTALAVDENGVDAPAESKVFSATGVWRAYIPHPVRYLQVKASASGTDAVNKWTVSAFVIKRGI